MHGADEIPVRIVGPQEGVGDLRESDVSQQGGLESSVGVMRNLESYWPSRQDATTNTCQDLPKHHHC